MKKLVLSLFLPLVLASLLQGASAALSSVPFTTSRAQFASGDSITIQEVLASSPNLQPGDSVVVRGAYTLQSREAAVIGVSLTASVVVGPVPVAPSSRKPISAGSGTFELEYSIQHAGSLHVTFYPAESGSSFGGIYFAPPQTPGGTSGLTSVPFATSRAQFAAGDAITIKEVLASSPRLEPGDTVVVRGQYTLQSRAEALLMISLTANAPGATATVSPSSRKDVNAGSGTFELAYEIKQPGSLHVTFYPGGEGGSSFGGIYFAAPAGTGGSTNTGVIAISNPVANTGKLGNLAVRSVISPGEGALVAGVTVTDQERYVLIRAVGPSLSAFGVAGTLRKPVLSVHKAGGELVATTGSWSAAFTGDQRTGIEMLSGSVGAFPLMAGSDDAVLNLRLVPGGYTVTVASGDGQSGVALLEVYASSTYTLPVAP